MIRIAHNIFVVECEEDIKRVCSTMRSDIIGDDSYSADLDFHLTGIGHIYYPCVITFDIDGLTVPFYLEKDRHDVIPVQGTIRPIAEDFKPHLYYIGVGRQINDYLAEYKVQDDQVMISVCANAQQPVENIRITLNVGDGTSTVEQLTSESGNGAKNGYVSVSLLPQDADAVRNWLVQTGVKDFIDPSELHATLFYAQADAELVEVDPTRIYTTQVKQGIHRMGEEGGEWEALTVHLEGGELAERHAELGELMKATHSYPDYMAHLSLKYKPVEGDMDKLTAMPFPLSELRFTGEKQEDIRN